MKEMQQKIEELNNINKNWIDIVRDEQKNNKEPSNKELVRVFNELWDIIRDGFKKDYNRTVEIMKAQINGDSEWLQMDVKESLDVFFALKDLRNIEPPKCMNVIRYFFENVILFFDPEFANEYVEFGFDTVESFWNTARVMDGLVSYYINKHFSKKAIIRDLEEETGLEKEICEYICDNIEDNYSLLQRNVIMDMLKISK